MPPLSYREDELPRRSFAEDGDIAPKMIWPHLLIYTARTVLYSTTANQNEEVYQKRLKAAEDASALLRKTRDLDANFHEVAMAVSTTSGI